MPSVPDAPLTQSEFHEFQTRLFVHLDRKFAGMDEQFGAIQSKMKGRFDELILVGLRRVEESRG